MPPPAQDARGNAERESQRRPGWPAYGAVVNPVEELMEEAEKQKYASVSA